MNFKKGGKRKRKKEILNKNPPKIWIETIPRKPTCPPKTAKWLPVWAMGP